MSVKDYSSERQVFGSIEVICGSMFSGKTEELIRRLKRAVIARQQVMVFKPTTDNRYSNTAVVSHDASSLAALTVDEPAEILQHCHDKQVIGIDEAQFFAPSIVAVCQQLASQGKRVIVAGLDMDYLGQPFGAMPQLMACAESLTKVRAICVVCGGLASFSHRIAGADKQVELGAQANYQPLCRKHFLAAQANKQNGQ